MATLTAISFTLAGGIGCFAVTLGMFGCAVKRRHPFVAARCTARPSNAIYNPSEDAPECQKRGNPMLCGWIGWVMGLSFETMLRGVPGTGTRKDGMAGSLLRVNLDGIVLLRFHHLCLRVSCLALVLYLLIVLPVYSTIEHCTTTALQLHPERRPQCQEISQHTNLTDYQRLTLANVPPLLVTYENSRERFADILRSFFLPDHEGLLARLYAVVLCSWIVTWYAMNQLEVEWIDVLALRRVYYLEADHWNDRRQELAQTLLATDEDDEDYDDDRYDRHDCNDHLDDSNRHAGPPINMDNIDLDTTQRHDNHHQEQNGQNVNTTTTTTPAAAAPNRVNHLDRTNTSSASADTRSSKDRMTQRDPWVPHPEQRDTVPNIDLYSILVGGLPSLPSQVLDTSNVESIFSRKQSIDWQLSVTTAFFDHCVPNQPGFSSSVAAVTILPAAAHLTEAWKKWYLAAGKLRRLRYIRQQIALKRAEQRELRRQRRRRLHGDAAVNDDSSESSDSDIEYGRPSRFQMRQHNNDDVDNYDSDEYERLYGGEDEKTQFLQWQQEQHSNSPGRRQYRFSRNSNRASRTADDKLSRQKNCRDLSRQKSHKNVYQDSLAAHKYYQEVLGTNTDLEVESNLLHAMHFGPEQTAVYSREFATGAANLAPHGCCAGRVARAGLDELIVMEQRAAKEVHDANLALRRVQEAMAEDDGDEEEGETIRDGSDRNIRESIPPHDPSYRNGGSLNDVVVDGGVIAEESSDESGGEGFENGDMDAILAAASKHGSTSKQSTSTNSKRLSRVSTGTSSVDDISFADDNASGEMPGASKSSRKSSMVKGLPLSVTNPLPSVRKTANVVIDGVKKVATLGHPDLLDVVTQKPRKRTPSHRRRGSVTTTQLPENLGLESELFRQSASMHHSPQMPRNSSMHGRRDSKSRRSKRDASVSKPGRCGSMQHGQLRHSHSMDTRAPRRSSNPVRRVHSDGVTGAELGNWVGHSVDCIDEEDEEAMSSVRGFQLHKRSSSFDAAVAAASATTAAAVTPLLSNKHPSRRTNSQMSSESGASGDSDDQTDNSFRLNQSASLSRTSASDNVSVSTTESSLWDKLEEEKRRKSELRARLNSIQSLSSESSFESDDNGNGNAQSHPKRVPMKGRRPKFTPPKQQYNDEALSPTGMTRSAETIPPRVHFNKMSTMPRCEATEPQKNITAGTVDTSASHVSSHTAVVLQPEFAVDAANKAHVAERSNLNSVPHTHLASPLPQNSGIASRSLSVRSLVSVESASSTQAEDNLFISERFETSAGLRRAAPGSEGLSKRRGSVTAQPDKWKKVDAIVREGSAEKFKGHRISNGRWKIPSLERVIEVVTHIVNRLVCCSVGRVINSQDMVEELAKDSTYAVVTFTSRQAAVAARHCLADSRGGGRWRPLQDLPVPPLADASSGNIMYFRGCCRPVTLSLNDNQKLIRNTLALAALGTIYFFYTIPLVAAQGLVSPERLQAIFPDIFEWQEQSDILANLFSGIIPALVYTGFFAICPFIFKTIANFGSNATSFMAAENSALRYFWWFMLLAAFSGTSFSTAVIEGFERGISIGAEVQEVIETVARTIPTQVSATWLNWLIFRFTIVLPTQYLLQLNTFVFSFLGMPCCARAVQGGGAGGPVPYRIYVDSGVVMLCLFALAPASPLIAPAAFMYFASCVPLLRWTMIFLYRPRFDTGGQRFPFIFDMMVSGMFVGQVLLVAMMALKRAVGPALMAALPMLPTLAFRIMLRSRFLPAFEDAALLQTSLLDGWDTSEEASEDKREEFRRFLVDSHKAAYVPVCIANDQSVVITAEPAVVVPQEADIENALTIHDHSQNDCNTSVGHSVAQSITPSVAPSVTPSITPSVSASLGHPVPHSRLVGPIATSIQAQPGPMMRRASTAIPRRLASVMPPMVANAATGAAGASSNRLVPMHSPTHRMPRTSPSRSVRSLIASGSVNKELPNSPML